MSDVYAESLKLHAKLKGKIEVKSKIAVKTREDLSLAYTPGVAEPCRVIAKDKGKVYDYTMKGNLVAVISDGTAVLGLGDIGPEAGLPVMEGKALLFKEFAGIDAIPLCLDSKDPKTIIEVCKALAPTLGGINLEDISAPRCFEIEDALVRELDIPVMHDDQHGTAIVVSAALRNALKVVGKKLVNAKIVVSGAGAAGTAVTRLLLKQGAKNVIVFDSKGALCHLRGDLNSAKARLVEETNPQKYCGSIDDAIRGADVFVGVSGPNVINEAHVRSMAKGAIVFAMANPVPEIMPDAAKRAGAAVVGTGRSDYPNQINNVLAFPGVFRGALDSGAKKINDEMKLAAVEALVNLVPADKLSAEFVVPSPLDKSVVKAVATAVAKAAKQSGVARA